MTNGQKKQLEQKLWNIANELRGKMNADEFRDYCLGFIFYKYLSEKLHLRANAILKEAGEKIGDFLAIDEKTEEGQEMLGALKDELVEELGYFPKPSELFSSIARRGAHKAEANVTLAGRKLHADATGQDMYAAIDLLVDKLDRQLIKHKEKLVEQRRGEGLARMGTVD